MVETEAGGGFLMRWSERKEAARRGRRPPAEPVPQVATGSGEVAVAGVTTGSEVGVRADADRLAPRVLTDADMPPLDSLDGFADYSAFLSPGVSADLRRRALAQLFHSPHLNVTDGLSEFAEDYTRFEPLGDLVTAEMRHRLDLAAQRLAEAAVAPVADSEATSQGAANLASGAGPDLTGLDPADPSLAAAANPEDSA